jgi:phosphopantothenoylcysteine decarboxylase/phosphopantothenate--cysteine ligase
VTLAGKHVLVTAGPTHEPIDPVRVIANRSSGRQGFAIAAAAADAGARVTLVAGPVALDTPAGVERIDVETAEQMADAVMTSLPADAAILVAAVADWRVDPSSHKLKKGDGPPSLSFLPTRDILAELGASARRPHLLVGFAAETENVVEQAVAKREAKGADWIVANDVSGDVMGGARNRVHLVTGDGVEDWPEATKEEVARRLVARVADALG